jgi:hypothetical protein
LFGVVGIQLGAGAEDLAGAFESLEILAGKLAGSDSNANQRDCGGNAHGS